jgi:hypothetical protein
VFVKMATATAAAAPAQIDLPGVKSLAGTAAAPRLAADPQATNSIDAPRNVVPVSAKLTGVKSGFTYTIPANAIVVLTLETRQGSWLCRESSRSFLSSRSSGELRHRRPRTRRGDASRQHRTRRQRAAARARAVERGWQFPNCPAYVVDPAFTAKPMCHRDVSFASR